MTVQIVFTCDHRGCNETFTPNLKVGPYLGLELYEGRSGWSVESSSFDAPEGWTADEGRLVFCPAHALKGESE